MLIEAADNDPNDEIDEVSTFCIAFLDVPEGDEDTSKLDETVCEPLDLCDDNNPSQGTHMVGVVLNDITKAMNNLSTYDNFAFHNHLLSGTDAPKIISSED